LSLNPDDSCFVYGCLNPDAQGGFHVAGVCNGKAYYSNSDSTRFIIWDGINTWYIAPTVAVPVGPAWELTQASHIGIYSPINGATGNAINTIYEGIQYNVTGTLSPDVTGPVYKIGTKNGKDLYICEDVTHYLLYEGENIWLISDDLDDPRFAGYWECATAEPPGVYTPTLPNTGNATVAAP